MPQHTVHCVVCAKPMRKLTVGNIEVDCCDEHGVWLDVGEMSALLNQKALPEAAPPKTKPRREQKGALDGVGKGLIQSAARGAGFGAGSTLASVLIRKILG